MSSNGNRGERTVPTPETASRLRRAVKEFESDIEERLNRSYYGKVRYEVDLDNGQILGYVATVVESRR